MKISTKMRADILTYLIFLSVSSTAVLCTNETDSITEGSGKISTNHNETSTSYTTMSNDTETSTSYTTTSSDNETSTSYTTTNSLTPATNCCVNETAENSTGICMQFSYLIAASATVVVVITCLTAALIYTASTRTGRCLRKSRSSSYEDIDTGVVCHLLKAKNEEWPRVSREHQQNQALGKDAEVETEFDAMLASPERIYEDMHDPDFRNKIFRDGKHHDTTEVTLGSDGKNDVRKGKTSHSEADGKDCEKKEKPYLLDGADDFRKTKTRSVKPGSFTRRISPSNNLSKPAPPQCQLTMSSFTSINGNEYNKAATLSNGVSSCHDNRVMPHAVVESQLYAVVNKKIPVKISAMKMSTSLTSVSSQYHLSACAIEYPRSPSFKLTSPSPLHQPTPSLSMSELNSTTISLSELKSLTASLERRVQQDDITVVRM